MLEPGVNCWRIERATRASIIVDADDYFRLARAAMLEARKRIMLIGWDFDTRIDLDRRTNSHEGPTEIGDFVYWLVERSPQLEVYLLRWDIGALKTLFRGTTILKVVKWARHPRIHVKLDSAHPPSASHHQKIVVLDDSFAFCGGIDMTEDRWDTRAHRDADPDRREPGGKPCPPWHDATTARWRDPSPARSESLLGSAGSVPAGRRCWPFRPIRNAGRRSCPRSSAMSTSRSLARRPRSMIGRRSSKSSVYTSTSSRAPSASFISRTSTSHRG